MTVIINGTTGISGVDGSAATPAVQGADTNTGVFYPAADTVGVSTGGSERVRVDSSGNVGIGGTPSGSYKLQVIGTAASTFAAFGVTGTTTSPAFAQFVNTGCTTIFGVEGSVPATLCTGTSAYASIFGNSSTASVQFITANSVRVTIDSSGNLQFNSGYGSVATAYGCRAWVNFNGTGTVAILASGNVSSITDNGTGEYTVNFTSAMPDANYVVSGSASFNNDNTLPQAYFALSRRTSGLQTASAAPVSCVIGSSVYDCQRVEVAIFR